MKPRKALTATFAPGAIVFAEMMKPEKGNFPIARTDSGVVCFIAKGTKGFFEYGSVWEAQVIEVHETKLVIKPIECTKTAAAHAFEAQEKAKKLFGKVLKVKKEKPKYQYQYNRAS